MHQNGIKQMLNRKQQNKNLTSRNQRRAAKRHNTAGASMAEIPLTLSVLIVILAMPLLCMATLTLKSALLNAAVQDGAFLACKAKTYQTGTTDKPAAIFLAEQTIKANALKFAGLNINSVSTDIIITPVAGGPPSRTSAKLAAPADTSRFIYQIETVAKGQIEPLINLNPKIVGNIPGVSAPMLVSYAAREMAENPQGLDK
jgi:hypothetical protein